MAAYRGAGLRDAGLRRLFPRRHADHRDRRPQDRLAPGLAATSTRHRGPARHPLGVLLVAVRGSCCPAGSASARPSTAAGHRPSCRPWPSDWPFFRTLVQNMEMVMAKSDMTIARRYASLVPDQTLAGDHLRGASQAEWDRTRDAVLAITGQAALLGGQPELRPADPPAHALCRAAQPPADRTDPPPPRGRRRSRACAKASCWPSTASRRDCATAAEPRHDRAIRGLSEHDLTLEAGSSERFRLSVTVGEAPCHAWAS